MILVGVWELMLWQIARFQISESIVVVVVLIVVVDVSRRHRTGLAFLFVLFRESFRARSDESDGQTLPRFVWNEKAARGQNYRTY